MVQDTRAQKKSPVPVNSLRRPGHTLRQDIRKKTLLVLLVLSGPLFLYLGSLLGAFAGTRIPHFCWAVTGLFWVYCGWFFWWERKQSRMLEACNLGLDGEVFVGEYLNACGAENHWHVLHDFDTGRGNIDHIVITPQGVFTVETKVASQFEGERTIYYDSESIRTEKRELKNPLGQAAAEARHLSDYLREKLTMNLFVQPIVNYPGWGLQLVSGKRLEECKVWVCLTTAIPKVIGSRSVCLSDAEQEQIYNFLASENQK